MPEAERRQLNQKDMSWFSKTEDYSIEDSGFYGEPEITYGLSKPSDSDSTSGSSSTSGAWDDYQHEREYVSSCWNNGHSR